MSKYYGKIGFAESVEIRPGVWKDCIVEKEYKGDWVKNYRKLQDSGLVNDDLNIADDLTIILDPYAACNYFNIKYVTYMGTKWKAKSVEVQRPRLRISLGGIYNG